MILLTPRPLSFWRSFFVVGEILRFIAIVLFALLLPFSANAATCSAGYYSLLPSGYTELEYLESTGTQYINTHLSAPDGIKASLRVKFNQWPTTSAYYYVWGSHNSDDPWGRNYLAVGRGGIHLGAGGVCYNTNDVNLNEVYDINMATFDGNRYLDVNNDNIPGSCSDDSTVRSGNDIYLFRVSPEYLGNKTPALINLYNIKFFDENDVLLRNFIPVRRNSDNAVGMYDTVTDTFFANSGTGTFVAGADVSPCAACTNKPANSHYTGSGGATNNCPFECDSGYGLYNGVCHARCPYGDGELHVGQYTHPLWADITNVPSPSVYIGELGPNHDGLCYAYLEPDDTPVDNHHGFHTVHNGVPYHAINLGLYGLE